MNLTSRFVKQLRTIGHRLKPVIIIANGISDNINTEIDRALGDHELIKIRVNTEDRYVKRAMVDEICARHKCELVQLTGNIALIYRQARQPNPKLSNILRYKSLP
ncbi:MAG: YhbY family RNA-binding protein [Pseudohongiellaceae bacterium]